MNNDDLCPQCIHCISEVALYFVQESQQLFIRATACYQTCNPALCCDSTNSPLSALSAVVISLLCVLRCGYLKNLVWDNR